MTWTLTSPIGAGDMDSNGPYAEVGIVRFVNVMSGSTEQIKITLEYGNTVNDVWVPGIGHPEGKAKYVYVRDTERQALKTEKPDRVTSDPSSDRYWKVDGVDVWIEYTEAATERTLFEWLNTNGYIDAGSVT